MSSETYSLSNLSRLGGAIMLISGTAIGAAVLALPISTGRVGLFPSLVLMGLVWFYLTVAALYLLEVQLSMPQDANLVSMAEKTLGKFGKYASSASYLFLLFALNTAYTSALISLFGTILKELGVELPKLILSLPLLFIFMRLYRGGLGYIDQINRFFMMGLIVSFLFLALLAMPYVQVANFAYCNWSLALGSLSILLTAFGYHVVIPSLVSYLDSNVRALKQAIWIGSSIPFLVYAIWQIAILGIAPQEGALSIASSFAKGTTGAELLVLSSPNALVSYLTEGFAFCVVVTSFLGVTLALFDFLQDGLKNMHTQALRQIVFAASILFPIYCASHYERIFFQALDYAGVFGVVLLLALIPALMAYKRRYVLRLASSYEVPGGKWALIGFMSISILLILIEIAIKL